MAMDEGERSEPAGPSCANHPERPALGTCDRCGTFVCPACTSPLESERLCLACWQLRADRGKANHIPWLASLMMVHGGLMCVLGVLVVFAAGYVSFGMPGTDSGSELFLPGFMVASALLYLVPGGLQLFAGWQVRDRRGRVLAFVALGSGMLTLLSCYCFVTSLALAIYGLVVLLDQGVADAFEARAVEG